MDLSNITVVSSVSLGNVSIAALLKLRFPLGGGLADEESLIFLLWVFSRWDYHIKSRIKSRWWTDVSIDWLWKNKFIHSNSPKIFNLMCFSLKCWLLTETSRSALLKKCVLNVLTSLQSSVLKNVEIRTIMRPEFQLWRDLVKVFHYLYT